jgi:hypothetical protein
VRSRDPEPGSRLTGKTKWTGIALAVLLSWLLFRAVARQVEVVATALSDPSLASSEEERIRAMLGEDYELFAMLRRTVPEDTGVIFCVKPREVPRLFLTGALRHLLYPRIEVDWVPGAFELDQESLADVDSFFCDLYLEEPTELPEPWRRIATSERFALWRYGEGGK